MSKNRDYRIWNFFAGIGAALYFFFASIAMVTGHTYGFFIGSLFFSGFLIRAVISVFLLLFAVYQMFGAKRTHYIVKVGTSSIITDTLRSYRDENLGDTVFDIVDTVQTVREFPQAENKLKLVGNPFVSVMGPWFTLAFLALFLGLILQNIFAPSIYSSSLLRFFGGEYFGFFGNGSLILFACFAFAKVYFRLKSITIKPTFADRVYVLTTFSLLFSFGIFGVLAAINSLIIQLPTILQVSTKTIFNIELIMVSLFTLAIFWLKRDFVLLVTMAILTLDVFWFSPI